MLKIGDKVVYVWYLSDKYFNHILKPGHIYTINAFSSNEFIKSEENTDKTEFYHFEETGKTGFNSKYFIPLIEYRKNKIKKIKERIYVLEKEK